MAKQAEVIIVGAGMAGAAAALRLGENGIKSIVLEAQQRLGGRVQTIHLAEGVDVDFGASYVHGYQRGKENPTRRLAEKLGIPLHVPQAGPGIVFGSDKRPLDADYLANVQSQIGEIMAQKEAEQENIALSQRVVKKLRAVAPEAEPLARLAELGAGISLEEIAAKHWKTERGFAGVDALPEGGYLSIVKAALDRSQADVLTGSEVVKLEQLEARVRITVMNGSKYEAPYVLVTAPVAVLRTGAMEFVPPLPADRTKVLERVSVGLLDKFALLYDEVWWPSKAANFVLLPASPTSSSSGNASIEDVLASNAIMVANMHALSNQKPKLLLVYLGPRAAAALEHFHDDELTSAIHSYVAQRLQHVAHDEPRKPELGRMVRWKADKYALGATTSPFALNQDAEPEDLDLLGQSLWSGRLGFAGEGTDRHLRGSIVGAVASGEREAERIVRCHSKPV